MRFSKHFEDLRPKRPDRADITLVMCERVRGEPSAREDQARGRTAFWGYVSEKDRYLKVVVEADGEEITTAHWDRGFKRWIERQEGRG